MAFSECKIDDCDEPVKSIGMCSRHSQRYWKYGDPLIFRGFHSAEDRFWAKVNASGVCWEWTGWIDADGYGGTGKGRAHRAAWEMLVGPIPDGMVLDHLCRNSPCVNPDHLEVVTVRENTMRGRAPSAQNARKAYCKRGHELSGRNLSLRESPNGRMYRRCLACHALRQAGYNLNRKAVASSH